MSDRICVVTGGAGFIGCAISAGLLDRFDRVIAVDVLHPQVHRTRLRPAALADGVELVRADVSEAATWNDLLSRVRPSVVVHLAAETGTGQSLTEATRHSHTNVCGTAAMLDAFARTDIVPDGIILSSSRAVYGEGQWQAGDGRVVYPRGRSREQLARGRWDFDGCTSLPSRAAATMPAPSNVYGATKLAQEHVLSSWAAAFGTRLTILRLQNVYGPGQSLTNAYTGIVSLFCRIARDGNSIPLYEDGAMLRDFVFIDDVADAFLKAVGCGGVADQPLDVGTGKAASIAFLANQIAALYGAPAPHVCGKYRFGDVRHAACVTDDTASALGWTARVSTGDGLKALAAWIETQLRPTERQR